MQPVVLWSRGGRSKVCRCHDPSVAKRKGLCEPCYRRQHRKPPKQKQCPVKNREYKLRSRYGITSDQYGEMLIDQGGRCAICREAACDELVLHVDHCHKTGRVRELLCSRCNSVLGMCGDTIAVLEQAIAYLQRHQVSPP